MRVLDFSGNVLLEQNKEVQIAAQSSVISFTVDEATLAEKAAPDRSFLVFDLEMAGKRVSRNLVFLDVTHNLELPLAPKINATINNESGDYTATLQSSKLARNVF